MNTVFSRTIFHIANTWRHHFNLQMATTLVLVCCFTVATGAILLSQNLSKVLTLWGESMQMSVYLSESADSGSVAQIQKFIENNRQVENSKLISKKEALHIFKEQMASYAPDILSDPDLIKYIPTSIQFGLSKLVSAQEQLGVMQELATSLRSMQGVEEVSFGQDWVKSYSAIAKTFFVVEGFFIVIILGAAALVMANSIHTSIHQRRHEIEVMELIGATARYIRFPFIWEGAVLGLQTSSLAILFCYALYSLARDFFQSQIAFLQVSQHLQFLSISSVFLIVLLGTLLGALASWLCLRNINTGWAASHLQRAL